MPWMPMLSLQPVHSATVARQPAYFNHIPHYAASTLACKITCDASQGALCISAPEQQQSAPPPLLSCCAHSRNPGRLWAELWQSQPGPWAQAPHGQTCPTPCPLLPTVSQLPAAPHHWTHTRSCPCACAAFTRVLRAGLEWKERGSIVCGAQCQPQ